MLRALLLAAPGAGKGTQGERMAADYGVPHLATGDLLRRHVADGTPLGIRAGGYMQRGELVPDDLVVELVREHILGPPQLTGFVLDGFPRTLDQAKEANSWGGHEIRTFHGVLSLDVPDDELVRRLLERGRSSGRSDDTEDVIRNRLQVYAQNTEPLLAFYRQLGVLHELDGTGTVDEVESRVDAVIRGLDLS